MIIPALLLAASAHPAVAFQETATVRDSAGVRIVENHRPAWTPGEEWILASVADVTIGRVDGAEHDVLSSVSGAVRLSDGSVAVGDGGAHRVRIYDPAGRHLVSFGGPGEGPGEFGVLGLIGRVHGDSIGVWDPRRKRVTVFSRTGRARTGPAVEVDGIIVPAIGWAGDGSVVVTPTFTMADAMGARPGETRGQTRYVVVRPDGRTDTLLVLRGREVLVTRSDRSYIPLAVLFGRNGHLAASAEAFVAGESDTFELSLRAWDGRLLTVIRRPGPARAVTTVELRLAQEAAEEARRRSLDIAGTAARGAVTAVRRPSNAETGPPHRSTHPHFDGLVIDATGHIWVRESAIGSATRSWLVFDPDGIWLGAMSIPAELRITDIGRDYVLGVHRDELGVETVRLYRLDRRNAASA